MWIKKPTSVLILCISLIINAQESAFYSNPVKKDSISKFQLEVFNLNFFKNNEYFNEIADGYTLLGTLVHPELIYNTSNKTQFKTGVIVHKTLEVKQLIPTFTFLHQTEKHYFAIGNLFVRNNRHLIEPIMASERLLGGLPIKDLKGNTIYPLLTETGFEYKYLGKNTHFNTWLNWTNLIKKRDDKRERFTAGFIFKLKLLNTKNNQLDLSLNSLFHHRGGQINKTNNLGILNINNSYVGLLYKRKLNPNQELKFSAYYLSSYIADLDEEFPFNKGKAFYLTSTYLSKTVDLSLSYFNAHKFISPTGNTMFQTYSTKVNRENNQYLYSTYNEPNRSLCFLKAIYKFQLEPNILLGIQTELFYQLTPQTHLDYSYALYVRFNDVFDLLKTKK